MEKIYRLVGLRIKIERKKLGLSQENLALKAGISQNFLGHIERGTKGTSLRTIERIAQTLKIPVGAFFSNQVKEYKITEEDKSAKQLFYLIREGTPDDRKNLLKVARIIMKKTKRF